MRSVSPDLARSALDAAPDAIIIIDAAGVVLYANRQVSALFAYPHEDIVGRRIEELIPERLRAVHVGHRERYAAIGRMRAMGEGLDLFALRSDGSEFPVEISLSPIQDGDQTLVAAAIRDVTARKRAASELILARQTADRAREVADEARQSADRANQGKSRFLATASHDLRQPLQTLALLNGTLRRMVCEPAAVEALEHQELAIGTMSRLLNTLLDISKLESGAVRPVRTDFSVATLFTELRNEFAELAAGKGLELEVMPSDAGVHSDPSLVEQILRNLMSNAIKYTDKGKVLLRCERESPAGVRIEVIDTGVGIPADQLPYICDEFFQVGVPTNSSRNGYGLGLSIVQRLVNLLDLGFDVQSEVGRGSHFSLVVPVAEQLTAPGPHAQRNPAARPTPGDKATVLLVEDDPAVRNATRMLLKVDGYRVITVSSLSEACAKVREPGAIDLLVTDYHLRDNETGTQVISAVRDIMGSSVKAVLMTGDTSSAIQALPLDTHLRMASKPIKAEELLTLIKELLAI